MNKKMRLGLLSILLVTFVGCPVSQTPVLGITVAMAPFNEGRSILEQADGNFLVTGVVTERDQANEVAHLLNSISVTSDATVEFSRSPTDLFFTGGSTFQNIPATITSSGDIALAGSMDPSTFTNTIRIVRYTSSGQLQSNTLFPFSSNVHAVSALSPGLSDDIFVASGLQEETGSFTNFVIHIDAQGAVLWMTPLDRLRQNDFIILDAVVSTAGNVFLVGSNFASGGARVFDVSGATGEVLWNNTFDESPSAIVNSVAATPDGGAVFAGPPFGFAPVVTRVDADGNLLWVNSDAIGSRLDADDYQTKDIAVDSEGNTVVVGLGTKKGQILMFQIFTDIAFIAKYDPDGDMLWLRTLPTDYYLMNAVTVLHDGTYATAGLSDVNGRSLNVILFDPETGDVIN